MNDLIYRQAVIDVLADYIHNVDKVYSTGLLSMEDCDDAARSVIEELPSAEPEIIRCKECKHYDGRPCGIVDWYNTADDFCSRAERRTDE